MTLRPAHELEELARLCWRFDARHQLRQRDDLFVDSEDPCANIGVMLVRHVLNGEYLTILFGSGTVGPETGIHIADGGGRVAENDDGRAVVVVDQGPNV